MSEKKYDEIRFAMAEKLPKTLLAKSSKKVGLVAIKTRIGSLKYDIDPVDNPTKYIKALAKAEKINMAKVFSKFKDTNM